MPRIKEINSQVNAAGPVGGRAATAEDFGAGVGRAISHIGEGFGDAEAVLQRREEQNDISALRNAHSAQGTAAQKYLVDRVKSSDVTSSDPAVLSKNQAIIQDFIDQYDDSANKIRDSIKTNAGRKYFEEANSVQRQSMVHTAMSAQAEVAGAQTSYSAINDLDKKTSMVLSTPTEYQAQQTAWIAGMEATKSLWKNPEEYAHTLMKGKTEFAKSQILGIANLDAKEAQDRLMAGEWDKAGINGLEKESLVYKIKAAVKAEEKDKRDQRIEDDRVKQDVMDETQKTIFADIQLGKRVTEKDIILGRGKDLDVTRQNFLIHSKNAKQDETLHTDKRVLVSTLDKIWSGEITKPEQIQHLVLESKITPQTYDYLSHVIADDKTQDGKELIQIRNEFLAAQKAKFYAADASGLKDVNGPDKYAQLQADVRNAIKKEKETDGGDPRLLFQNIAGNKKYMGLGVRQASPQERVKGMIQQIGGNLPPPNSPQEAITNAANATGVTGTMYSDAPTTSGGLTTVQQTYNDMVKKRGGSAKEMFNQFGAPPEIPNVQIAKEAEKEVATGELTANSRQEAYLKQQRNAGVEADAKRYEIKKEIHRIEQANIALKVLGQPLLQVPTLAPLEDPFGIKKGTESIQEWKARTGRK